MADEEKSPIQVAYERRNRDLDPQLVWRGKDEQDWSDLVVPAPPLYIQEKVHPKVLIDDLLRQSRARTNADRPQQLNLFADFNGLPAGADATDFYRHEGNWTNRMILGDSLQVMASLAEREGLRGQVQCIYIDPPYGIKFNSNFQWSTTSRDVKDGNRDHITREPEQVKAFRDTWRDGIHSYLTYLRDRLTVARDLLADSGSIFVQIGDENVHRVRAVMDEVFGEDNAVSLISFRTTTGLGEQFLDSACNYLVWYCRDRTKLKYRELFKAKGLAEDVGGRYRRVQLSPFDRRSMTAEERAEPTSLPSGAAIYRNDNLTSQSGGEKSAFPVIYSGQSFRPGRGYWKTNEVGMQRLLRAERIASPTPNSIQYVRFLDDFAVSKFSNVWTDTQTGAFTDEKIYVVQTNAKVIARCTLMTTDPGDLVLDPTCGSGTTAYVAEQWGRRWITIDTSRVALALARARIMGARYPYYLLADSNAGQLKEAEITRTAPSTAPTYGSIRHGFVYERVPHITLKSIANNAEIDVIWERHQETLEPLRQQLNAVLGKQWEEWEIPRDPDPAWPDEVQALHRQWWEQRIARQREIDASIEARADQEFLYDRPYEDRSTVRVAGPFTVESLSPHRILVVDENDELQEPGKFVADGKNGYGGEYDFTAAILENLRLAGVQQAHKEDRLTLTVLTGWPGHYLCAEGRYLEGESGKERRAGIFIGPEFGTVSRSDLAAAAREAGEAGFDVLIACAFNYDAHSAEFEKLGRIPVLKARMNADLHMADTLKTTGAGNLFVIFGEPDIDIEEAGDNRIRVKIHGVDIFHPQSGEVRSSGPDGIACWFIDTDYNEESFFVRHAYFLGANDPYKALKTTLKAEIDEEAWESLHSDVSRPFDKPQSGRIAVKVINHLGDEVMKVFSVS
ncbi:MAG: DNA methyltransferase [Ardenticatenaceae bacterium]|nr:DNA methyltransferase [Ardenticatenaceae bacterium]